MSGLDLLPCPFCANGNKALQIFKDENGLDYVRCLGCGATGPRRWNPQDASSDPALNGWNVRAWVPPSSLTVTQRVDSVHGSLVGVAIDRLG